MRDVGLWREAHAICAGSYGIFGLVAFFSPILTGAGSGSRPDHDAMRNVSFVVMFSMMLVRRFALSDFRYRVSLSLRDSSEDITLSFFIARVLSLGDYLNSRNIAERSRNDDLYGILRRLGGPGYF